MIVIIYICQVYFFLVFKATRPAVKYDIKDSKAVGVALRIDIDKLECTNKTSRVRRRRPKIYKCPLEIYFEVIISKSIVANRLKEAAE